MFKFVQALIEQSDFLDILSPELERARIKRDYVLKKKTEYEKERECCKQKDMMISQQLSDLGENKKRLYYNVNKKLLLSNYSYLPYDNEHEIGSKEDKEKEIVDIIYKNCRTLLPPRKNNSNTITTMRSRRREESVSKKKSMSTNTSLNQVYVADSLSASPLKTTDGVVNPNKSFFLLWNSRIQQSITNLTEITKEDIGGENCCKRLLKAYYHNINFTNKVRSNSQTDQHIRPISQSSQRQNRRKLVSPSINISL